MKTKSRIVIIALAAAVLANPSSIYAKIRFGIGPTIRVERKELKNEFKEEVKGLRDEFKKKLENFRIQVAKIIGGEITAISGTSLTVNKDAKTYTVNTDANTHFQRHYWGKSSLAEFSVGNKVNVRGKFTDEAKTTILAHLIRNLSIMKRHGVFLGDVTVKNGDNFVISSKNRGNQTVYFSSSTKFVKRNQESMTYADLQVGQRVRVRGLWDKSLNKITEVSEVKDYALPPKPTKAVKPTHIVTPTITLTPTLTVTPTSTPTLTPTP